MKTPYYRIGLVTIASAFGLLGCEKWQSQALRHNQDGDSATNSKLSDVDASIPKGERSSVTSGTWSQQAREIESHLGK